MLFSVLCTCEILSVARDLSLVFRDDSATLKSGVGGTEANAFVNVLSLFTCKILSVNSTPNALFSLRLRTPGSELSILIWGVQGASEQLRLSCQVQWTTVDGRRASNDCPGFEIKKRHKLIPPVSGKLSF